MRNPQKRLKSLFLHIELIVNSVIGVFEFATFLLYHNVILINDFVI